MTKPKLPWDFSFSGIVTPEKGAKILRFIAHEVEISGVRNLAVRLGIVEPQRTTRKKRANREV
jgi:hypothetical protein